MSQDKFGIPITFNHEDFIKVAQQLVDADEQEVEMKILKGTINQKVLDEATLEELFDHLISLSDEFDPGKHESQNIVRDIKLYTSWYKVGNETRLALFPKAKTLPENQLFFSLYKQEG